MYTPQTDQTGLRILLMINSPCSIFDLELKQHKFVEESREENKSPVSTEEACIESIPKVKHRYEVHSALKLSLFALLKMDFIGHPLTCL